MADSELQQLAKTDRNPVQEGRYQTLLKEQGAATNTNGSSNPVDLAKQLIQVNKEANQPAIQTLQGNVQPLKDKYDSLVSNIRGAGTVAANAVTKTTANELGARGLLPSSTYGQQQIEGALLPVNTAYEGQAAQTALGGQQDINTIMSAIAQLQAGNPSANIQSATGYAGYAQQAQAAIQAAQIAAQAHPYAPLGSQGLILNQQSGDVNAGGLQALLKALNGL